MKRFHFLIICLFFAYTANANNKLPPFFIDNYAKIPAGSINFEGVNLDIAGFYMFKTELTNLQYQEFIHEVSKSEKIEGLLPTSSILKNYYNLSIYQDYPVRGISQESAIRYCQWLKEKLSINLNIDINKIDVKLPSRIQWIYAAKGGEDNNIYSWNGPYMRDANGKFLVNFNRSLSAENIGWNTEKQAYEVIIPQLLMDNHPMPVSSLTTNNFGLFNMCGNVSELVSDTDMACGGSYNSAGYDVRAESYQSSIINNETIGFRPIIIINE